MYQFGFLHTEDLHLIRPGSDFSFVCLFWVVVLQGFKNVRWTVVDSKCRRMGFTYACSLRIRSGLGLTAQPAQKRNRALSSSTQLWNPLWQVV